MKRDVENKMENRVLKIENMYRIISKYLTLYEQQNLSLVNKMSYSFYLKNNSINAITLSQNNKEITLHILFNLLRKYKNIKKVYLDTSIINRFKYLLKFKTIFELKIKFSGVIDIFVLNKLNTLKKLTFELNDINFNSLYENFRQVMSGNIKFIENSNINELVLTTSRNTYFSFYINTIPSLKKLIKLDILGEPNLCNINFLNGLDNLEELSISIVQNLDFSPLKNLNKLKILKFLFLVSVNLIFLKEIKLLNSLNIIIIGDGIDINLDVIKELDKLKSLKIQYDYLGGLSVIENLSNLEELDLSNNLFIPDFNPIETLTSLRKLNLSNCDLQDVSFLSGLQNLEELDLSYNKTIKDYEPIKKLKKLKIIRIVNNL